MDNVLGVMCFYRGLIQQRPSKWPSNTQYCTKYIKIIPQTIQKQKEAFA